MMFFPSPPQLKNDHGSKQQQDAGRQHFFVHECVAVVARILEERAAIFQQTIQLKIPVILRFAEQEISTIAAAAPPLFHQVE